MSAIKVNYYDDMIGMPKSAADHASELEAILSHYPDEESSFKPATKTAGTKSETPYGGAKTAEEVVEFLKTSSEGIKLLENAYGDGINTAIGEVAQKVGSDKIDVLYGILEKGAWGNDAATWDKTNLNNPAQRQSFVASDPNKDKYGPKIPGSPAAKREAGQGTGRSGAAGVGADG